MAAPDRRDDGDASDPPRGPELETKLADLRPPHPSSAEHLDPVGAREAEYADHVASVRESLSDARKRGEVTHLLHTVDGNGEVWTRDRQEQHDKIIDSLYAAGPDVPCEGRAIIVGGLPGAGKTSVLREHLGAGEPAYLVINPDVIKAELARRELVPAIDGLTPMEATELAHEESSHIAKRLAGRALAEHRNVAWDITMASESSLAGRIQQLREAGYARIEGIFVDVPIETSLARAAGRHREDDDRYRAAGDSLGGRLIPGEVIEAQADERWGSVNRRNFEQLKDRFDAWYCYDNSGDKAMLTDRYPADGDEPERRR